MKVVTKYGTIALVCLGVIAVTFRVAPIRKLVVGQ